MVHRPDHHPTNLPPPLSLDPCEVPDFCGRVHSFAAELPNAVDRDRPQRLGGTGVLPHKHRGRSSSFSEPFQAGASVPCQAVTAIRFFWGAKRNRGRLFSSEHKGERGGNALSSPVARKGAARKEGSGCSLPLLCLYLGDGVEQGRPLPLGRQSHIHPADVPEQEKKRKRQSGLTPPLPLALVRSPSLPQTPPGAI